MRSEPHAVQSSHWTTALRGRSFLLGLFVLLAFHFIVAAFLPPVEDELYYWSWSQDLGLSYFDHPPLVAYLIRISTAIFGKSLFGIRFFSPLVAFLVLFILAQLSPRPQLLTWLMLTPLFLFGSVLITPDTPLLLFWVLYLYWMTQVNQILSGWSDDPVSRVYHGQPVPFGLWVLGGALLGLGFMGKYSMFLAAPCSFLTLFSRYRLRAWIGGYVVHAVVALIFASPVFLFNWQNEFVSFQFQWGNAMAAEGGWHFNKMLEFLGSQVLLIGGLPLLMLPWLLLGRSQLTQIPRYHVCFYFFTLPLLFFIFQSLRTKLEANWALVAYLSFWPMAQFLLDRNSFKGFGKALTVASFAIPIGFSIVLGIHLVKPLKWIPPHNDRIHRMSGQFTTFRQIGTELAQETLPVYSGSYQWVAYLRYFGINAKQVHPSGRMSQYTLSRDNGCTNPTLLFLSENGDGGTSAEALKCFSQRTRIKEYPVIVRGTEVFRFYLVRYSK